jgi:DNA-binding transcriptional MerR regulator
MAQWQVKEVSRLTRVSVRTLHYYDAIGLLKPSYKTDAGYRIYSDEDMIRLQQICVLKFFGLSLASIQKVFKKQISLIEHLNMQKSLLEKEINQLTEAVQLLNNLILESKSSHTIKLTNIFKSIEVLHMINDFKKSWAGKVFTDAQLKEFVKMSKTISQDEQIAYGKRWDTLITKVKSNMHLKPESQEGIALATEWMNLVNEWYGDKPDLRGAIWDAYKEGKIKKTDNVLHLPDIDQAMCEWIERAAKAGKLY